MALIINYKMGLPELKILIVEDNDSVREVLRTSLLREGYRVLEATNGIDALRIIKSNPSIDLLITDFSTVGMDGKELIKLARLFIERHLIISGFNFKNINKTIPVLKKPFNHNMLHDKIYDIMNAG